MRPASQKCPIATPGGPRRGSRRDRLPFRAMHRWDYKGKSTDFPAGVIRRDSAKSGTSKALSEFSGEFAERTAGVGRGEDLLRNSLTGSCGVNSSRGELNFWLKRNVSTRERALPVHSGGRRLPCSKRELSQVLAPGTGRTPARNRRGCISLPPPPPRLPDNFPCAIFTLKPLQDRGGTPSPPPSARLSKKGHKSVHWIEFEWFTTPSRKWNYYFYLMKHE